MNPTQKQAFDLSEADRYHLTETGRRYLDTQPAPAATHPDGADDPGSVPDVLRSAALYLERHGWCQGAYFDASSGGFLPPACVVGAIAIVCYGGPVDAPAQMFAYEGFAEFEAAVLHLDRYLLVEDESEAYEFNDAKGRTVEDVVHALRQAAATPEHELIDALKAIDDANHHLAESGLRTEQVVAFLKWTGASQTMPGRLDCWCDCSEDSDAGFCPESRPCGHCAIQHPSSVSVEKFTARLDGGDAR
ncbi:DUF6197 family protein [Actinoplanes xinjiangensis]|uniref:DUF6197 family protein n=1 Tax=Actinoplanes xinjiangensis TaxID=512350 RepID=UPI0034383549